MRICGVEEAKMNESGVCAAYAYLAYVETTLDDQEGDDRPLSPPPLLPADDRQPVPRPFTLVSSDSARPRPRSNQPLQSFLRLLHGEPSWEEEEVASVRLDFLSHLPPEISIYILRFLHPKYLCRVVQVSRRWRWLAQYSCLRTRRLRYVQRKREKYLQSKENVIAGHRQTTQTPQTLTRNFLTDCNRSSPLTSIQPASSRQRRARQTFHSPYGGGSTREGETPVRSSRYSRSRGRHHLMQSPVLYTPESGARHVHRALEEDSSYMVRRCLFPHSPSLAQQNQPKHYSVASPHNDDCLMADSGLSVKKNASKRRLKRL